MGMLHRVHMQMKWTERSNLIRDLHVDSPGCSLRWEKMDIDGALKLKDLRE